MKYFANIKTAEELRKVYRELCLTLHPDKGGNEEDFKAMQAEFESLKAAFMNGNAGTSYTYTNTHTETAEERRQREEEKRREREAWARWEEEERKAREEEERRERERIEKAQEENRRKVAEWAARLERVNNAHKRTWDFTDKKAAAAYVAATKRNIKAVINHYFPGLNVKIKISGQIWKEIFEIIWEDGPSVAEMKEIEELHYFVPSHYVSDPYADYGDYKSNEGTAPWREAYGQALGDCTDVEFTRTLSNEGKEQAEKIAAGIFANWNTADPHGQFTATLGEWINFAKAMGAKVNEWGSVDLYAVGLGWTRFASEDMRDENGHDVAKFYTSAVRRELYDRATVTVTPKDETPEFVPTYGPAYKAIKKALGGNTFFTYGKNTETKELTIFEAAEMLARGESVTIGKFYTYEWKKYVSGCTRGGYKTQAKRAEKYAASGVILEGTNYNTYGSTIATGIKPETLEALRQEAADIERQRKEWNRAQQEGNDHKATENANKRTKANKTTDNTTGATTADTPDTDGAPADGLQLVEIAGGVAVVGDSRTTYKNRKTIKAHGAKWNRDAQQWQATDPAGVATLRAWFGIADDDNTNKTNDTDNDKESDTAAQNAPESPQTGEAGDTTTGTPESDAATVGDGSTVAADLSPLAEAFANLFRIIADTMEEAKKYEGVTIPAETLERWRTETATGAKCAAAQLSEVCACLGCLTPDSRREFDALGVIFWTLAEQLRQGFNPEAIAPATDYARGQLFDLINRTQHPNQAAAVREATDRRDAA